MPDDVGDLTASAALLQGMTAHYLTHMRIWATYPLAEAAHDHQVLEARATTGKLLLRSD